MTETNLYPCSCACKCGRMSSIRNIGSVALARHARCAECSTVEHRQEWAQSNGEVRPEIGDGLAALSKFSEYYELSPEETEEAESAAKEVRSEIWERQWLAWQNSLPEKFQNAVTEHTAVQERLNRMRNGQMGVSSMVILGSPGYGKTYLSIAYANLAIREGFVRPSEVLFGTESELLASAANSGFGDVEKQLRRVTAKKTKFLILDDVGRGTWLNEAMRPKVFSLVLDKFWSENRVIVITSNLPPAELADYIGEGAMDRLRSLAGNSSVVLDTESKRSQITQEMLSQANAPKQVPPLPPQ